MNLFSVDSSILKDGRMCVPFTQFKAISFSLLVGVPVVVPVRSTFPELAPPASPIIEGLRPQRLERWPVVPPLNASLVWQPTAGHLRIW